ncbi:MAG: hypothetical protein WC879_09860 [Melioribacteraceae bacterium]
MRSDKTDSSSHTGYFDIKEAVLFLNNDLKTNFSMCIPYNDKKPMEFEKKIFDIII